MKVIFLFSLFWSLNVNALLNHRDRHLLTQKHDKLKYYLLSGEEQKAYAILKSGNTLFQKADLFNYYQTIFSYMNKNYKETLSHIKNIKKIEERREKQICQIEVISHMMIKQWKQAYNRWRICSGKFQESNYKDQYFLRSILESVVRNNSLFEPREFREMKSDPQKLELWMKVASYLDQGETVEEYKELIPERTMESSALRDINAHLLYNLKKIQLAYEMIKDKETHTASLLKTNIKIHRKRYEEAYNDLKKALEKKPLSSAILMRLILLTFSLEKKQEALKYINKYQAIHEKMPLDLLWKKTLLLISMYRMNEAKISLKEYMGQLKTYGHSSLLVVRKFIALQDGDELESLFFSEKSCRKNDETGCWLKLLLKARFSDLTNFSLPADYYQQFMAKLSSGWFYPANNEAERYKNKAAISESQIEQLDQVEGTKELFLSN